jgi:hypothetical protein
MVDELSKRERERDREPLNSTALLGYICMYMYCGLVHAMFMSMSVSKPMFPYLSYSVNMDMDKDSNTDKDLISSYFLIISQR